MIIGKPAPFVTAFVDALDKTLQDHCPGQGLSALQRAWLAFCLTAILVTNSICWMRFERASLGTYSLAALSWMFRHAKIPWEHLLVASVRMILASYGITSGSLIIDDTDKKRSKAATTLAHLYKLHDKESGGYLWGQSLVFLVFVTPTITIPVGVTFYQPAPELSAWYKCRLSNNFSRLTYKFSRVFEPLKTENRPVPTHIFSVQQAAPFSHNQGCANSPFHNEAKIYESGYNTIRKAHLHDDMKNYGSETETMCPFSGKPLDTTTVIMLHRKVMWQDHKSHMVLTH